MRPSGLLLFSLIWCQAAAGPGPEPVQPDLWRPIPDVRVGGVLGERLELWRQHRLWRVIKDPFTLGVFDASPGQALYQGEHVGKWLHAATLAYEASGDEELLAALQDAVRSLLAAQEPNGYLGTYGPERRFYAPPDAHTRLSWDVWTHRYVLYGLLTYERFHPDRDVVEACRRIGDLLISTFGPGKRDITTIGTRRGISSSTLLESMLMLYERTGEDRFLRFAEHLHDSMESNKWLRVVSHFNSGGDASGPGDGKAYQLMAVLLGYADLYRHTGQAAYREATLRGWSNIRRHHTYETGGPWTFKTTANHECFAPPQYYDPTNRVETCATTTWVQLCLRLLSLTGEARYAVEAERAALNHLIGAQAPDGIGWAYFTVPNCPLREYSERIECCASSGPRALEEYARHLLGSSGDALTLATYQPLRAALPDFAPGVRAVTISGDYPFRNSASLLLEVTRPTELALDLMKPEGTRAVRVRVNGEDQTLTPMPSGFHRMQRTWNRGDRVDLEFDFDLRAHFHSGRDGSRWVAFSYGPLALAQEVEAAGGVEPVLSIAEESEDARLWLEPVDRKGSHLAYRIKMTGAVLIPYYQAGSEGSGVRTFFRIERSRP